MCDLSKLDWQAIVPQTYFCKPPALNRATLLYSGPQCGTTRGKCYRYSPKEIQHLPESFSSFYYFSISPVPS